MLTIKNKADIAEIFLSGDIVDDDEGSWIADMRKGNSTGYEFPQKLREQLNAIGKDTPLEIHINSSGGSVFAGVAMANFIANHNGKTTCIVDGVAASIASHIFFSANVCKMPSNGYLMIHRPFANLQGNAEELRKAADILDTLQAGIEITYMNKVRDGVSADTVHEMVNATTWFTGVEAADKFKIDLLPPVKTLNAVGNVDKLKAMGVQIPQSLIFLEKSARSDEENKIKNILDRVERLMIK